MSSNAIISIRPEYAALIASGEKTVELRRRVPAVAAGTRLWIYATLPLGAVIGTALVHKVVRGAPTTIWNDWREEANVTRAVYREYFSGAAEAVALVLRDGRHVGPISLSDLRLSWGEFHPPQVMSLLTASESQVLAKLGKASKPAR